MLELINVTKGFAGKGKAINNVVDHVNLSIKNGGIFTLLGPSGCGKTTLLRMIAGIETPDGGEIKLNQSIIFSENSCVNLAPNKRKIGMVFQNFAIWPHMTVLQHVTFPLEMVRKQQNLSPSEIRRRAGDILEIVQLDDKAETNASQLSGGQKQRLAVARALVATPKIVLFDEPLSNLDAVLRDSLRSDLKSLQKMIGITFVYVTHDQDEALAMSDQIGVMRNGKIEQVASAHDIYRNPANAFVASFIGKGSILTGSLLNVFFGSQNYDPYSRFLVRPENVVVKKYAEPQNDSVTGRIIAVEFLGDYWRIEVLCKGEVIRAKVSAAEFFEPGEYVHLRVLPVGIILYQ